MKNISDGIIVFGKDKSEHDKNLHGVLGRLQERGLTLNSGKCVFTVPEITFFGFDISARGIRPNSQSVEAIRDASTPTNASEARSSGSCQFLSAIYSRFFHHRLPSA